MPRLFSYYGDDFTGSTDVMEALASHGIKTVLFTAVPSPEDFDRFADYDAIGIAGTSRSQTPEWMSETLPPILAWLKQLGARFCHYKICSTFDSSPSVGNIGRAIEIGHKVFGQSASALIVGAPQLKRYTFGCNLFAAYQGQVYRIDRHPVMRCHPVTPMDEADLRIHLARQTSLAVLAAGEAPVTQGVHVIDVWDAASQVSAGRELLAEPQLWGPFVTGSSGVEYAILKAMGLSQTQHFEPFAAIGQLLVVSGSVSPTTAQQIRAAVKEGFVAMPVNPLDLATDDSGMCEQSIIGKASSLLAKGQSPLIHTAMGTESDRGQELDKVPLGRERLGKALGRIAEALRTRHRLPRIVIAGGDTSSHALGELNVMALTTRFPLRETPGSPLCTAHLRGGGTFEVALKGGQVGSDSYFVQLRDGFTN